MVYYTKRLIIALLTALAVLAGVAFGMASHSWPGAIEIDAGTTHATVSWEGLPTEGSLHRLLHVGHSRAYKISVAGLGGVITGTSATFHFLTPGTTYTGTIEGGSILAGSTAVFFTSGHTRSFTFNTDPEVPDPPTCHCGGVDSDWAHDATSTGHTDTGCNAAGHPPQPPPDPPPDPPSVSITADGTTGYTASWSGTLGSGESFDVSVWDSVSGTWHNQSHTAAGSVSRTVASGTQASVNARICRGSVCSGFASGSVTVPHPPDPVTPPPPPPVSCNCGSDWHADGSSHAGHSNQTTCQDDDHPARPTTAPMPRPNQCNCDYHDANAPDHNPDSVCPNHQQTNPPNVPTGLSVSLSRSGDTVSASFSASGQTYFNFRWHNGTSWLDTESTTSGSSSLGGVDAATTVSIYVRACNLGGCSGWSQATNAGSGGGGGSPPPTAPAPAPAPKPEVSQVGGIGAQVVN